MTFYCPKVQRALQHRKLIEKYLREGRSVSGGIGLGHVDIESGGTGSGLPGAGFLGPISSAAAPLSVNFPANALNDWIIPSQNGASGTGLNFIESYNWKFNNGYMAQNLILAHDAAHVTTSFAGSGPTTFNLTATDTGSSLSIASLAPKEIMLVVTGGTGVQPTVPSSLTIRARLLTFTQFTFNFLVAQQANVNPQTLRFLATLSDGSANPQNFTVTRTTGGAAAWNLYSCTAQAGSGACDLIFQCFMNPADMSTLTAMGFIFGGAWM